MEEEGHHAMVAKDGEEALKLVEKIEFDVIVLDWKMPKVSGIEVCRQLREMGNKTPILLLTALSQVSNKVEALNSGADDYITKPFSFEELLARVKATKRRYDIEKDVLVYDDFSLDLISRKVETNDGKKIELTDKEFDLLKYFIINKGTVISKALLCKYVCGRIHREEVY